MEKDALGVCRCALFGEGIRGGPTSLCGPLSGVLIIQTKRGGGQVSPSGGMHNCTSHP